MQGVASSPRSIRPGFAAPARSEISASPQAAQRAAPDELHVAEGPAGSQFALLCSGHGPQGQQVALHVARTLAGQLVLARGQLGDAGGATPLTPAACSAAFDSCQVSLRDAECGFDASLSGASALCVSASAGGHILVAHAGACGAVLARRGSSGALSAVQLEADARLGAPSERCRLESSTEGVRVEASGGSGSAAAAAGAWHLVVEGQAPLEGVVAGRMLGCTAASAYGVLSTPLVTQWPRSAADRFVILGSPALWRGLSCDEAVEFVGAYMGSGLQARCGLSPADALTLEAQARLRAQAGGASSSDAAAATWVPAVAAVVLPLAPEGEAAGVPSVSPDAGRAPLPAGARSNAEAVAMAALWQEQPARSPGAAPLAPPLPQLLPALCSHPWLATLPRASASCSSLHAVSGVGRRSSSSGSAYGSVRSGFALTRRHSFELESGSSHLGGVGDSSEHDDGGEESSQHVVLHKVYLSGPAEMETLLYGSATSARADTTVARHLPCCPLPSALTPHPERGVPPLQQALALGRSQSLSAVVNGDSAHGGSTTSISAPPDADYMAAALDDACQQSAAGMSLGRAGPGGLTLTLPTSPAAPPHWHSAPLHATSLAATLPGGAAPSTPDHSAPITVRVPKARSYQALSALIAARSGSAGSQGWLSSGEQAELSPPADGDALGGDAPGGLGSGSGGGASAEEQQLGGAWGLQLGSRQSSCALPSALPAPEGQQQYSRQLTGMTVSSEGGGSFLAASGQLSGSISGLAEAEAEAEQREQLAVGGPLLATLRALGGKLLGSGAQLGAGSAPASPAGSGSLGAAAGQPATPFSAWGPQHEGLAEGGAVLDAGGGAAAAQLPGAAEALVPDHLTSDQSSERTSGGGSAKQRPPPLPPLDGGGSSSGRFAGLAESLQEQQQAPTRRQRRASLRDRPKPDAAVHGGQRKGMYRPKSMPLLVGLDARCQSSTSSRGGARGAGGGAAQAAVAVVPVGSLAILAASPEDGGRGSFAEDTTVLLQPEDLERTQGRRRGLVASASMPQLGLGRPHSWVAASFSNTLEMAVESEGPASCENPGSGCWADFEGRIHAGRSRSGVLSSDASYASLVSSGSATMSRQNSHNSMHSAAQAAPSPLSSPLAAPVEALAAGAGAGAPAALRPGGWLSAFGGGGAPTTATLPQPAAAAQMRHAWSAPPGAGGRAASWSGGDGGGGALGGLAGTLGGGAQAADEQLLPSSASVPTSTAGGGAARVVRVQFEVPAQRSAADLGVATSAPSSAATAGGGSRRQLMLIASPLPRNQHMTQLPVLPEMEACGGSPSFAGSPSLGAASGDLGEGSRLPAAFGSGFEFGLHAGNGGFGSGASSPALPSSPSQLQQRAGSGGEGRVHGSRLGGADHHQPQGAVASPNALDGRRHSSASSSSASSTPADLRGCSVSTIASDVSLGVWQAPVGGAAPLMAPPRAHGPAAASGDHLQQPM